MNKKPIIAFLYDFDKTLCTTDMQDYTCLLYTSDAADDS